MKLQLMLTGTLGLGLSFSAYAEPETKTPAEPVMVKAAKLGLYQDQKVSPKRGITLEMKRGWKPQAKDKRETVARLERIEDGMIWFSKPSVLPSGQMGRKEFAAFYSEGSLEMSMRRRLGKDVLLRLDRDPTGNLHARAVEDYKPPKKNKKSP